MTVSLMLFWRLVFLGVVALVRYPARSDRAPTAAGPRPSSQELLAERFARGEIDDQEYRSRLDMLDHDLRARV